VKQHEYREVFRKQKTFRFDCTKPYPKLDRMNLQIHDLENEMIALQESADLFEVNVPDYKQLKVSIFSFLLNKKTWSIGRCQIANLPDNRISGKN